MYKLMTRTAILLLACMLVGCAQAPSTYVPRAIGSPGESQKVLAQLLREQASSLQLQEVQVEADYFKCTYVTTQTTRFLFVNKGITTVPLSKFVYFNSVKKVAFYKRRSTWHVILGDKAGIDLFAYQTFDEDKAKEFVDIVVGLSGLDPSVLSKPW